MYGLPNEPTLWREGRSFSTVGEGTLWGDGLEREQESRPRASELPLRREVTVFCSPRVSSEFVLDRPNVKGDSPHETASVATLGLVVMSK